MGNVIAYSGISAKVRAMQAQLLSEEDFKRLGSFASSHSRAAFLRTFRPYRDSFDENEGTLHRADIERRLLLSIYRDFDKLYRFSGQQQRRFLNLYFEHFEARRIKACLQAVIARGEMPDVGLYWPFMQKYAHVDLIRLCKSDRLETFIDNLEGTVYHAILKRLYDSNAAGLADYETAIDMRYFNTMWKKKDKVLTKEGSRIIAKTLGSRIDFLNLSWIYRSKKYYRMTPQEIYGLLIPVRYRISLEEMKRMVEADSLEAFEQAERQTYYGDMMERCRAEARSLYEAAEQLLAEIYKTSARENPYSIAPLNTYFFLKEREIVRIVNIIERAHYQEQQPDRAAGEAAGRRTGDANK